MAASPSNSETRWRAKPWVIGFVGLAMLLWVGKAGVRWWVIHRATAPAPRTQRIETLTQLPPLPRVPWEYAFRNPSREERTKFLRDILAVKLSTYPDRSVAGRRAGKHRTMGFTGFEPTPAELETLAAHYDVFYLTALSSHRIPSIKRGNPKAKVLMYFACSLTKEARLVDAGSVDEENTDWILAQHPDWLLKDKEGRPVAGKSWSAKYWADPGNRDWQRFFARKLNHALDQSGGQWDGVILDEFLTGRASPTASWAGASPAPTNYATDQTFQEAQLDFLRTVAPRLRVPLVPNVEPVVLNPTSTGFNPEFFTEVQRIGGGAEAEVFVFHRPGTDGFLGRPMVEVYLDRARQTPKGKMMFLNAATAGSFAGNTDLTLFSYFTYLLVASPEREIYWTCKEGDSEIPHFWYKEFDLDLGPPKEEMQDVHGVWKRDFANATVLVNLNEEAAEYAFPDQRFDVFGRAVRSPIRLEALTGRLLISNSRQRQAADHLPTR